MTSMRRAITAGKSGGTKAQAGKQKEAATGAAVSTKKKGRGGAAGPAAASRALPAKAQDAAAAASAALVNTAGALHHLTFLDEGRARLVGAGGVRQLVALLQSCGVAAPAAWDNALGALWNASLLAGSERAMEDAGAPVFLRSAAAGASHSDTDQTFTRLMSAQGKQLRTQQVAGVV